MPFYRFRLEAQDGSGHFRSGVTEAPTKAQARQQLELKELRFCAYEMPDQEIAELLTEHEDPKGQEVSPPASDAAEEEKAEFRARLDGLPHAAPVEASEEEKDEFRALPRAHRSHLNLHRQREPYKLVKLEKVG